MKALVLALVLSLTSTFAMAREPKATAFSDLAKKTVTTMYGNPGDVVSLELKSMNHDADVTEEVWIVSLSNGAQYGSAAYEVSISMKNGGAYENDDVATVLVKYLSGT